METHKPFLTGVLREANSKRRQQKIREANKHQINAMSELIMNVIRANVPISGKTKKKLMPHAKILEQLQKPRLSVKKRKEILMRQTGGGMWEGLHRCYKNCKV